MNIDIKLSTELHLVKTDAAGNVVWEGRTSNLITDTGLAAIIGGGIDASWMGLSSLTSAPTVGESSLGGTKVTTFNGSTLFPSLGTTCTTGGLVTSSLGRKFSTAGTWGSVARCNSDGSLLYSRALIRDLGGNPTTVTLLAGESLDVKYSISYQLPTTEQSGSVSGIDYAIKAFWGGDSTVNSMWLTSVGAGPWFSLYGNTSANVSLSNIANDLAQAAPLSWTASTTTGPSQDGKGSASLGSVTVSGNTASRTMSLRVDASISVPGNVIHGFAGHVRGLYAFAIVFPNTKPSKTTTQEFRLSLTFSVTR